VRLPLHTVPAQPTLSMLAKVVINEEKGSDVNLATIDAYDKTFNVAVIVKNNSDLAVTPVWAEVKG
jgi:hypothetical protein